MNKKKKRSIIKFTLVGVFLAIFVTMSFVSIPFGNTTLRSFTGAISLGIDLRGGVFAVYDVSMPLDRDGNEIEGGVVDPVRLNATRTRLQEMLFSQGFPDAIVVIEGSNRIRAEVPDVESPEDIFRAIGEPARLEFRDHNENVILTGENVVSASSGFDVQQGEYVVHLRFDAAGTTAFGRATAPDNHGQQISIFTIVGVNEQLVSAPRINAHITDGRAVVTGMQDAAAARRLADQITAGQFDLILTMRESATVSATLGENALNLGLIAGLIGLLLIIILMIAVYRVFGVLTAVALIGYTVLMLFFLAALPWVQLTLPGIAGILLSIGMSVDGNIIMFERIKDEFRKGKSIKSAANTGLKKGFWTVFDAEITTVMAAVVLLIFGTGPIRNFAITLLVGIVLAMFVNLVVIRQFVNWTLNFNSTNAKLYGLRRGKEYAHLAAHETDITIAEREKEIEEAKRRIKEEKKAQRAKDEKVSRKKEVSK